MIFVFQHSYEQHTPGVGIPPGQLTLKTQRVAPCLPPLQGLQADMPTLLVLAADCAIAGILLIPGAARKVIIIQVAERHGEIPGFLECARTGIPMIGVNPPGYALYLH